MVSTANLYHGCKAQLSNEIDISVLFGACGLAMSSGFSAAKFGHARRVASTPSMLQPSRVFSTAMVLGLLLLAFMLAFVVAGFFAVTRSWTETFGKVAGCSREFASYRSRREGHYCPRRGASLLVSE